MTKFLLDTALYYLFIVMVIASFLWVAYHLLPFIAPFFM